jgi:hypothetical protein
MSYAEDTSVSVEKSRAQIEAMIVRAGASKFASMISEGESIIGFALHGKHVKFVLPLPDRNSRRFTHRKPGGHHITKEYPRSPDDAYKAWEQACRSRWRALGLCIKAKLEAVEAGITTFEAEFLAHFVTPGGSTIGERVIPQLEEMAKSGKLPPLLLG